jgi:hypothetical protein
MKHLLRLNEYVEDAIARPQIDKMLSTPMSVEMFLKKIADRYNSLISKSSSESLENNMGLDDDFMRSLKGRFSEEDLQGALGDNQDILNLLTSIRQSESSMSEQEKKDKAMEIVQDIFKGKGFDLNKLEFKLDILDDGDLMDAKHNVIGVPPEQFKEIKDEIEEENPKLKKELDIRAIQNALTQGFASSIKDDFVMGDTEIEGVSFGDYYSLMDKTFNLYSKVPKEMMHQVMTQSPALGRVELVWDEDKNKYVIEASGYTILILVHEIVKGILDLISMHRDPELEMEDEEKLMSLSGTQYSEREGLQYGPGMVNQFKEFFNQVEQNLLDQRDIMERNPAMMLNVLSRFYKMQDSDFLAACKLIFSDNPNKPYDLFEEFYLDGLERRPMRGGSQEGGPDGGSPGGGPNIPDDLLRGLLGDAGISLNMDPGLTESAKYVMAFNIFNILESKKDLLDQWSKEQDRAIVVNYIDLFSRLVDKPKGELVKLLTADIPGVNVDTDLNSRKNIEKYDFRSLKNLVDYIVKQVPTPQVTSLKKGDINQAILQIQRELGLRETGFYDEPLEDAIKTFQTEFKEGFSNNYDWVELHAKLNRTGISSLKPIERIQLAKSAEFITTTENLIARKEEELNQKIRENAEERDVAKKAKVEDEILVEFNKIENIKKDLKSIKSILSGGIENPSGKLDPATISAFMYSKGMEKLEGLGGGGTLKPSGGEIIEDNDNYRVYRVLSQKFCIETRKQFDRVLNELGSGEKIYNWCISWDSSSFYGTHRLQKTSEMQTIYFIENKKRAEYEFKKWKEFKDQGGSIYAPGGTKPMGYLDWRMANGTPQMEASVRDSIKQEGNRKFYDNYHIAVVFATNKLNEGKNSFWLVGASNNGQWGDQGNHFTFEKIASVIWPRNENDSIRRNQKTGTGGGTLYETVQVPQEIIDQSWYTVPSDSEMENLENNLLIPMPLSSLEVSNTSGGPAAIIRNKKASVSAIEGLTYDQKEEWLSRHYFGDTEIQNFITSRNKNGIPMGYWKILPDSLKALYIQRTIGATLDNEQLEEIKDNPRLMKSYQDFIKRRLVGEDGSGGIIDQLKDVNTMKRLEEISLNNTDLELISQPYNFIDIKEKYKDLRKQINELPLNTKMSARMAMVRQLKSMKIKLDQYMNIVKKYRESLVDALRNIKRDNPRDVIDNTSGIKKFKELARSAELSKLYQSANALLDVKDKEGKSLFGDTLANEPGMKKLNQDWKEVPVGQLNRIISIRRSNPRLANALIDKFISVLLTSGEKPNADVLRLKNPNDFEKYYNQLDQTLGFIKSMNEENLDIINLFLKKALLYYDFKSIAKQLNSSNSNKLYKLYDSVLVKFPELMNEYNWRKSDSFVRDGSDDPGTTRVQRTSDREELG